MKILKNSGQLWNWPAATTLTQPTLSRILHLHFLYQKILHVPGNILEFGVHYGTSSNILMNFRRILEPNNSNRQFHLFDTFQGFKGTSSYDGDLAHDGDFWLPQDYQIFLQELIETQNNLSHARKSPHMIWVGDAPEQFDAYLEKFPHHVIAMAILDMDIFEPTRIILDKIASRMTRNSILVLDQFNCDAFPGETLAMMEIFKLHKMKIQRTPFGLHAAYLEF